MVEEVKKGIKGIRVPSKRISDTIDDDLFKKKIMQAGFDSISDFNAAFKAAGGELGDLANKTRFLNSFLPKDVAPYRNIITDRLKSKYEILSGGATPGTVGAPENKVYWQAATAAEKEAIEKFPKDTKLHKQKRLTHVKKYLKNAGVPAKWLLNNLPKMGLYATAGISAPISAIASAMLYAGTSKPAKGALPEESLKDKVLRDIDFSAPSVNAQLLEQMSQDAVMKKGGGIIGYAEGGPTGLYANIHAKRKRIKAGSGEKMRQVGSQGAPTKQSFIDSAKTAKKAGGGMMNINEMIKPIGMAGGGDPRKILELKSALKALNMSLMLAEGTGTPSFLGGGSSQQIRDLQDAIREIEIELINLGEK